MTPYRKVFWGGLFVFSLSILACITINIYFPAEKVESAAKQIVDDIRGQTDGDKGNEKIKDSESRSLLLQTVQVFSGSSAYAEDITDVSNPTIRALKERMKTRYEQIKPYFQDGRLKEGDDGYVSVESTEALGLKAQRDLKNLVAAENEDRRTLYGEVAKALKIEPNQIEKVAEIFAGEWQNSVK